MESPPDDPTLSTPTGMEDDRGFKEWQRWKSSGNRDDLSVAIKALDGVMNDVTRSNPGLNRHLMKAKAKTRVFEALNTFDPAAGASLSTHVRNHLKPLTLRSHNETRAIPKGRFVEESARDYRHSFSEFIEFNGREPTAYEMADRLKISPDRSSELMRRIRSYEVPESQIEGPIVADEVDESTRRLRLWSEYVYHDLTPRDQLIMDYRLGRNGREKLGLEEIAARMGLSPAAIHKVSTKIAERIVEGADRKS